MTSEPPVAEDPTTSHDEHPAVARLLKEGTLADGARRGGIWLAAGSWGTQIFQFLVSIVMAHLLLPSQFGETALVNAIAGFALIFTDLGLSAAVIHAEKVTDELLSTAFWLSAISGVILTVVISLAAFPIARLYGKPQLAGLFIVVSLNFTFSAGAVHLALLERTFNFRKVAIIEAVAAVLGVTTMPVAALAGFGVYSIVLGPLVNTLALTVILWASVPWRPGRHYQRSAMRQIWDFSKGLVGFNAVNYWSRNLDNVLLGARVSNTQLGDYNRSYNLMMIPVGQINTVLMRGLYPALARMQTDLPRVGRAWIRAIAAASGAFTMPLTLTMMATAPAFVEVLYGHRWSGMVPSLELLCLAAVPQMIGASVGAPYRAADRTSVMFKISLVNTTITVIAIVVGLHWGATGVAAALLVKSWINLPIAVVPLARILGVSARQIIVPLWKSCIPTLIVVAAELSIRFLAENSRSALSVFVLQLAGGLCVYVLTMLRSRSDMALEVRDTLRGLIHRRE